MENSRLNWPDKIIRGWGILTPFGKAIPDYEEKEEEQEVDYTEEEDEIEEK